MPDFRLDYRSNVVLVGFKTPHGKRWISTGERNIDVAKQVCTAAKLAELEMLAKAGALTAGAVSALTNGRRFTCRDVLAAWQEHEKPDLAPDSLAKYHDVLQQGMTEMGCLGRTMRELSKRNLSDFINAEDASAGNRKMRRAAFRSFYRFAVASAYTMENTADLVKVRIRDLELDQIEPSVRMPMTQEEFETLMASKIVPERDGKPWPFFRWASALAYWLGLRQRDICCLEWAAIKGDTIIVWTKKRGKRVALPIDDPLLGGGAVRTIFLEMMESAWKDQTYCFPEERAMALDPKRRFYLSVYYARWLDRNGIYFKTFHCLRHAFATRLKEAGKTVEQIAVALGHSNTETTKGYIHETQVSEVGADEKAEQAV